MSQSAVLNTSTVELMNLERGLLSSRALLANVDKLPFLPELRAAVERRLRQDP